jgi:alkanesulfonate monooxygenase SsuD/methylene tetrahydromethanopterin reductase-like flavin-dependent oxidoreductase (luciferase family)
MGFGLMLSTWTPFAGLAKQVERYRAALAETPPELRQNPGRGHVDIARWVYVAESDAKARAESEAGILRHQSHFASGHTSGYLGTVASAGGSGRDYDTLERDIILHGSPRTVIEKIQRLGDMTGASSIMLHYPPWYGGERTLASLELFADEVMPKFKAPERRAGRARA